ncbi:hypothetical protein LIER_42861 [Lithospermum erythrorhizon]|uniref:Uncharacterized protein n=1 Tax=Lithospermum erythrorhizon TaxID=34254 RepID=A0AAV3P1G7_LITER
MAEINPTLPIFFNMHTTSHSGPLTSFPAARYCNIFADPKPNKVTVGRGGPHWWKHCHYKVFYKEGVLIHAGLIRTKEFDQTVAPLVSWGISTYIFVCHNLFFFSDLTLHFLF